MFIHKEVKVEVGDSVVRTALCDVRLVHQPVKYRWSGVTCPQCKNMKPLLEEKAKEQVRKWKEENPEGGNYGKS